MPDTPNFAITFPCEGAAISTADFQTLATDVEAAVATVDAEVQAVTHLPYAFQRTTQTAAVGVATDLVFVASAFNFSSGITVGANTFTVVTPGLYQVTVQMGSAFSTLTLTSGRLSILRNGTLQNAQKRQGLIGFAQLANINLTGAVPAAVGDVFRFQFLWTGTGALTAPFDTAISMQLLATP